MSVEAPTAVGEIGSESVSALGIHDLGPLIVEVDHHDTPLRGAIPTRILTMLLVHANRRVSVDALLDAVWNERSSDPAVGNLESHVWRLRKLLEPRRTRRQEPTYLVNDAGGYRLILNSESADSLRFAQLAEQGDRLLVIGDASRALDRFDGALALWRGRPYGRAADEEWAVAPVARLEELQGQVHEQRIEALLRVGQTGRAIGELKELLGHLPIRERLWEQLMLALYRAGRMEEALATYHQARDTLLDTLGLEPGEGIRSLQARILAQDPALTAEPPTVTAAPAPSETPDGPVEHTTAVAEPAASSAPAAAAAVEIHLPTRLSPLIGRDRELSRIVALLERARLVTLVGSAGCGKTRLAIEAARSAAGLAQDGIWFVDLSSTDDPAEVAGLVATTVNVEPASIGGVVTALSTYAADRQLLLVLDNCEHVLPGVYDALEALLAGGSQCRILATSREPVGFDGEILWTLAPLPTRDEPAASDGTPSPSAELFLARARSRDPLFEPTDADVEQIESLCAAVDGIPLAIELAAGLLRSASVREVNRQVTTELAGLSGLGYARTEHHRTLETAIGWSVRLLSPAERELHALLSVLPGIFTLEAAQAIAAEVAGPRDVANLLVQLTHRSLLAAVPPSRPGQPTRFRQLATVRAQAEALLRESGREEPARARRTTFVAAVVESRPAAGAEDHQGWHSRVDDNHHTVAAVLHDTLVARPDPIGVRLVARMAEYWFFRGRVAEGDRWLRAAQSQQGAPAAERALVDLALASNYALRDRTDLSVSLVHSALADEQSAVDSDRRGYAFGLLGAAWCVWLREDPALDFVNREVHRVADGDPDLELWADVLTAKNELPVIGPTRTSARAAELIDQAVRLGNVPAAWLASWLDVFCSTVTRRPSAGLERLQRVNEFHRRLGGSVIANPIEVEGVFATMEGDHARAAYLFGKASRLSFRSGTPWPVSAMTHDLLREVKQELSTDSFEAAWRAGDADALGMS